MSEKINQNGRSIPEMLGVLAIVGILSVGGIAGYGRAMMKYKLNKQLTQYTAIITGSYQLAQLRDAAGNKNVNLTRFMINSGVVPSEMIKPGFSNYIWDAMGNQIYIGIESLYFFKITISQSGKTDVLTCRNILSLSKELSPMLWQTHFVHRAEDAPSSNYDNRFYGDNYCTRSASCLKNLTPLQIMEICDSFGSDKELSMRILWK